MDDHYEALGLSRTATLAEIKTAYRLMAQRTHPDSQPRMHGDATEFLLVRAAYDTLSDPDARRLYDQTLPSRSLVVVADVPTKRTSQSEAMRRCNEAWDRYERGRHDKPKAPAPASAPAPAPAMKQAFCRADDEVEHPSCAVYLSLEEAFTGTKVKVVLAKIADCPTCQGTSVELVRGPDCLLCAGTGDTGQRGLVGRLLFGEPCPGCSGDGFVKIPRRCSECYGLGHRTTHTDTVMDLVAGIRDGTILPVPNTGCTLRVSVSPDKGFSRDGDNLRISKQLKASNLTKGATLSIRCLDGVKRQARVPPGSADGSQIILHHCGMPRVNSRDIGDLIVTVSAKPDG